MATGVLVVGIERATKILGLLTATDKSYAATIRLGQTTTTEDADGEVLQTVSASEVTDDGIEARGCRAARRHLADPVGGQRDQGRRQAGIPTRPRRPDGRVGRHAGAHRPLRGAATSGGRPTVVDVDVEVDCSSGTYIRALARDIGAALGVGGHLTALRRTRVGRFGLDEARTLDELAEAPAAVVHPRRGLPAGVPAARPDRRGGRVRPSRQALSRRASTASTPRRRRTAGDFVAARRSGADESVAIRPRNALRNALDCADGQPLALRRPLHCRRARDNRNARFASRRPKWLLLQGFPDRRWCPVVLLGVGRA